MLEVDAPKKDMFDTSKTYYLDPLKFTCTKFQTVKDKIKVCCTHSCAYTHIWTYTHMHTHTLQYAPTCITTYMY